MAAARPLKIEVPTGLRELRALSGNAELSRWEHEVVHFLGAHYRTFSNFPGYFATQGLNFQILRQLLPEYFGDRYDVVLEVGCGTGFQSLLLAPHAERLVGIDIPGEYLGYVMPGFVSSAEMASFLVNDCFGVDWAQFRDAFPHDVGLPAASADLVFSWTVLEHVPELPPMFAEMARIVKPGGVMIHVVPSVMSALSTLVQENVRPRSLRSQLAAVRRRQPRLRLGRGWRIPELHSEFLRGRGDYIDQLNLYVTDSFVHPVLEAGFAVERLLWLRDFNVAIVARKL